MKRALERYANPKFRSAGHLPICSAVQAASLVEAAQGNSLQFNALFLLRLPTLLIVLCWSELCGRELLAKGGAAIMRHAGTPCSFSRRKAETLPFCSSSAALHHIQATAGIGKHAMPLR